MCMYVCVCACMWAHVRMYTNTHTHTPEPLLSVHEYSTDSPAMCEWLELLNQPFSLNCLGVTHLHQSTVLQICSNSPLLSMYFSPAWETWHSTRNTYILWWWGLSMGTNDYNTQLHMQHFSMIIARWLLQSPSQPNVPCIVIVRKEKNTERENNTYKLLWVPFGEKRHRGIENKNDTTKSH